jgi:hypothetical protein
LEVQARDIFQAVEQDLALLAEADQGDVERVRSAGFSGAEDVWGTEHKAGTSTGGSLREEAAAVNG